MTMNTPETQLQSEPPVRSTRIVMLQARIGDKIRHKKLGWECTVTDLQPGWVTMETGLGYVRTQSAAHVRQNYEAA